MSRRRKFDLEAEEKRGGVLPLTDAVQHYLRASGLDLKLKDFPVFDAWNQAVGKELAQRISPVRYRRGELLVEVGSASDLHELSCYTGEPFRHAANRRLGRNEILSVVFKIKR